MRVPMVKIRPMRMRMSQRFMVMRMGMIQCGGLAGMLMDMMPIVMPMGMNVIHNLVHMSMRMTIAKQ